MKRRVLTYLFFFLICPVLLRAQLLKLPAEPDRFLEEYLRQTEKILGSVQVQTPNAEFSSLFQTVLDNEGRKEMINLIQLLTGKGVTPAEIIKFTEVFNGYQLSQNPGNKEFAQFLNYLTQSFKDYPPKTITETSFQLNKFFKDNQLYTSSFNQLKVNPTKVTLQYFDKKQAYFKESPIESSNTKESDIGWDDVPEDFDPWKEDPKIKVDARVNLLPVQGMYILIQNVDLTLLSPSDSIVIVNTSGVYNFTTSEFIGEGGKIDWTAGGNAIEATLDKFSFKASSGVFKAEKVTVLQSNLMKSPIEGHIEIKLEKRNKGVASSYPRFKSYYNDAQYQLPLENYEMLGGYTLIGDKVTTSSLFDRYSKLRVNKGSPTTEFEVIGQSLTLTDSLITSDMVSFVARIGQDSITHPAIQFRYEPLKKHIQLNKVKSGGFRNSMFSDTFHQVDIRCDAMSWDLNSGKMDFYIISGKQVVEAQFESFDFYTMTRLQVLSNAAGFNPLMAAVNIVNRKKENKITVDEMMQATKKERYMVSNAMLIGNQMGFFDFHPFENYYSISRKGSHYYLVSTGRKDFDDLVFSSLNRTGSDTKNATIDFETKSLEITGAQNFKLSDSLGIRLLPKDESMKVIGNKIFQFEGKIEVKNFTFYGNFVLEYEKFLVELKRLDSVTFIPLDIYKGGGKKMLAGNFQFGKSGKLYLNSPDNKSGRKRLPEYPKLEIPDGVTVYFDEKGRNHQFSHEVVFKANSLKLDSLNSKNPEIPGVFTLAKILKPIKDNLVVVADSSMGLSHKALGPYSLYEAGTILKANDLITLNKKGIFTSGQIVHLASTLNADKIKMVEDYTEASGKSGEIVEKELVGAYYPAVKISDFSMFWSPSKDSMAVYSEKGFDFYGVSTSLKGTVVLRNTGLFGKGEIGRKDSEISSGNIKFNQSGFLADLASIKVKTEGKDAHTAFSGQNLKIDFNVKESKVKISPDIRDFNSTEVAFLEFPYSSYKTTIDNALWDIKNKDITMQGSLENSVFTSTAKNQYNLNFHATGARYDIDDRKLSITGVDEIHTVDAAVIPPKGEVFVKNDGKLEPFTGATIVTDTLNRYHTLTNAQVTINSRLSYSGNADYQYINISLDTFKIKLGGFEFAEISPEGQILDSKGSGKLSTIAHAKVSEGDQVFLAKKMLYKGELTMMAPFKNLYLKGQVLPEMKKYPMIGGSWINYQGSKSENVSINVDETLKDGGKPLYVGLHLKYGANSDGIYPTFLSMKGSGDDNDIFQTRGIFGRDEEQKHFYVHPNTEGGNSAEFYDDSGILKFSGQFNLLGVPTKIFETVGTATISLDSMKYGFKTMMLFDFPIPIPTTQKMGQNIVKANLDAGNTDAAIIATSEDLILNLNHFIGKNDTEKYLKELQRGPSPLFKSSNKFLKTLVLSKLNLGWNPTANAYYSIGKIGVSNIGDVDINAMVNGYVEIVQSHSTGNELNIYLDLDKNSWYYFVYRNGQLNMVTSDEEVNRLINPVGKKEKEKGINFINASEAARFKNRFLVNYAGYTEEQLVEQTKKPTAKTKKKDDETEKKEGF